MTTAVALPLSCAVEPCLSSSPLTVIRTVVPGMWVGDGDAAADQTDALLPADPFRAKLVRVFDVIRVASLHLREVDELAGVRRVLAADDDDRVHLLGELACGVLPFHRHRADRVEDLRLLRDLRNVRDELLERPRWLR